MNESELQQLLDETQRRQRRKTDLTEFEPAIKEMMDANVSLPVLLSWLEKKGKVTTLPALRRYVRRIFGEDFYDEFVKRNGWQRTKEPKQATGNTNSKTEPGDLLMTPQATDASALTESSVDSVKSILRGDIDTSQYD